MVWEWLSHPCFCAYATPLGLHGGSCLVIHWGHPPYIIVCVCLGLWLRGQCVVKHAIPTANSCPLWRPFHTLGFSSTTPWDPCRGVYKGVPTNSCILAWTPWSQLGAVPQPTLWFPPDLSRQWNRYSSELERFLFLERESGFSTEATILWCYGARWRTRNNYQSQMGRFNGPVELCKSTDTNSSSAFVTKWDSWAVPRAILQGIYHSRDAWNAEIKCQLRAVPNLLLASRFND